MAALLNVHIKDYGGREFGGEYAVATISRIAGRFVVQLDYCGNKSNKRMTTAWLEIDEAAVQDMQALLTGADGAGDAELSATLAV